MQCLQQADEVVPEVYIQAQSIKKALALKQTLRLSSDMQQHEVSAERAMSSPCSSLATRAAPSRSSLSMASYRGL